MVCEENETAIWTGSQKRCCGGDVWQKDDGFYDCCDEEGAKRCISPDSQHREYCCTTETSAANASWTNEMTGNRYSDGCCPERTSATILSNDSSMSYCMPDDYLGCAWIKGQMTQSNWTDGCCSPEYNGVPLWFRNNECCTANSTETKCCHWDKPNVLTTPDSQRREYCCTTETSAANYYWTNEVTGERYSDGCCPDGTSATIFSNDSSMSYCMPDGYLGCAWTKGQMTQSNWTDGCCSPEYNGVPLWFRNNECCTANSTERTCCHWDKPNVLTTPDSQRREYCCTTETSAANASWTNEITGNRYSDGCCPDGTSATIFSNDSSMSYCMPDGYLGCAWTKGQMTQSNWTDGCCSPEGHVFIGGKCCKPGSTESVCCHNNQTFLYDWYDRSKLVGCCNSGTSQYCECYKDQDGNCVVDKNGITQGYCTCK